MNYGLVGLYAVFLIFVGYRGNAGPLMESVSDDAKGFAPYVVAILILAALRKSDTLKPFVDPFIGLAILSFVLKNYTRVANQVDQLTGSHFSTGGAL